MHLDGILSAGHTSQATANAVYKKQEEERSSLPLSWGNDTVSFSPEAVAAAQQTGAASRGRAADMAEEDAASAAFAKYMRQARGEESSGADPQEELERLKERLKKLTEQKARIATEEDTPSTGKQGKMEALDAEINQVISQIAELSAQMAAAKGEGQ